MLVKTKVKAKPRVAIFEAALSSKDSGESGWVSSYQLTAPPTSVTQVQPRPLVVCGLSFSQSQSDF